MKYMQKHALKYLEAVGYKARIAPVDCLDDIARSLDRTHQSGFFDEGFFQERLTHFQFGAGNVLPGARSIFVVSMRQPHYRFCFTLNGTALMFLVPPTFLFASEANRSLEKCLNDFLRSAGYRATVAVLPAKQLAVRTGLARYGRNSITYAKGWGSYHRLACLISDMPCDEYEWSGAALLDRCYACRVCEKLCPTNAIGDPRTLLRADRCLTYWNEMPADTDFPEWLDPSWHGNLIGCLRCQDACPENRLVDKWIIDMGSFDEIETRTLLEYTSAQELPPALESKLSAAGLIDILEVFPRNLRALVECANRERNRSL